MASCHEAKVNPNSSLVLSDFSQLRNDDYVLSPSLIRREITRQATADSDSTIADYYVRSYYAGRGKPLVWVNRKGVTADADTLVVRLRSVGGMGFSETRFRLPQIEADLQRARSLDFNSGGHNGISKVYARLEYNLTKALFRFAAGQSFGYTNPNRLLNRRDVDDAGHFRTLYGLKSPSAGKRFFRRAVAAVGTDSLAQFLDNAEPRSPYYRRLAAMLQGDSARLYGKRLILVNMERCRWRVADYPWEHRKYVIVNIPSLHLVAVDGDKHITMRIGCGSLKTKTPLLSSGIVRMDVNPQWIMPRSIVRKSIVPRLGNSAYFHSRHYFIRDRATGKTIEPGLASAEALLSGRQLAIQEGGEGNALGRIIFRFDNDFSIYLHDTSSKEVFDRADRDVSHGCIRVERPFELAAFLLGDGHEREIERIRYSMLADVSPVGKRRSELTEEQRAVADTLQRKMLIGSVKVSPEVPVFIWYFTLYPDAEGNIRAYDDVYDYDDAIYASLKNYM